MKCREGTTYARQARPGRGCLTALRLEQRRVDCAEDVLVLVHDLCSDEPTRPGWLWLPMYNG
jgi:hypothetical protein